MGCCPSKEVDVEWPVQTSSHNNLTGKHLVVDDSKENRSILIRYLGKMNITADECANGQLAIDYTKKGEYDCIWMDVMMPVMNGIDASIIIRKNGYNGIIIALTGQIEKSTVTECKLAGMNCVLSKPLEKESLFQLLDRFNMKPTNDF
jgi:CheY-like chemotaxis protein